MDFTVNVATAVRPMESARMQRSPTSRQQDVLENRTDINVSKKKAEPDIKEVKRAAERLNEALQAFDRDLAISIHDDGKIVVRVTDPKTGDVIRQIPPERVLEVEENLDKIVGLFVNDQA